MEFKFDVNKVLPEEFTLIRNRDVGTERKLNHYNKDNESQKKLNLSKIIDAMGIESSKAQGLRGITSSMRLKSSNHHVYLMKDSNANNGLGCVIGIIKVGCKHLFLLDRYGKQHECQPLCVLDFYIQDSKQRNGYGKRLFNYMLQSEQISPGELAIDRPSIKFTNFLERHYALDRPIPQVNNFVVYDLFFRNLNATESRNNSLRRSAPLHRKMISVDNYVEPRGTVASSRRSNDSILNHQTERKCCTIVEQECPRIAGTPDVEQKTDQTSTQPDLETNPHTSRSETRVRNFSRHSARQSSRSLPSILVKSEGDYKPGHNKKVQFDCNLKVHNLPSSSESNESPSTNNSSFNTFPQVQSSSNNESGNYTIDKVIAKINLNKMRLGTSWNVFGVPSCNSLHTSNPYASVRWKGLQR